MNADELSRREAELERSQVEWKATKADLERECVRLKAIIDELRPKAVALKDQCMAVKAELDTFNLAKEGLQADVDARESRIKELDGIIYEKNNEIAAIEDTKDERRKEIDRKIGQYRLEQRAKADKDLRVAFDKGHSARVALEAAEKAVSKANARLEALNRQHSDLEKSIASATKQLGTLQAKLNSLTEQIEPLVQTVNNLNDQVAAKNTELAETEAQITEFKEYEKKAWAALNAKDESLQERQTEIERLERFKPNTQSFLPPR